MMKECFHGEETFCFPLGSAQGNFPLYLRLLRAGRKRNESSRGLQNYIPLLVCITPRWARIKYKYRCTSDHRVGKVEASFSFLAGRVSLRSTWKRCLVWIPNSRRHSSWASGVLTTGKAAGQHRETELAGKQWKRHRQTDAQRRTVKTTGVVTTYSYIRKD